MILIFLAAVLIITGFTIRYHITTSAVTGKLNTGFQPGELGRMVDPFIGTGGFPAYTSGDDIPGATRPFGMVKLSPDTKYFLDRSRAATTVSTAGYYYGDNRIIGFSHTRMVGTGAFEGGHFRVIPGTGEKTLNDYRNGRFTRFSHSNEMAFPGYYAVQFPGKGIMAELTSTERTGIHRYTFSKKDQPHILIDVSSALGNGKVRDGMVRIIPEKNSVEGTITTFGSFAGRYGGIKVFFAGQFNRSFSGFRLWADNKIITDEFTAEGEKTGADFSFGKDHDKTVVELKLAISYVSIENAWLNLETEAGNKEFGQIVSESIQAWEDKLRLIRIDGGTNENRRIFYTALYHSFQMPTLFNDVNGEYKGFDKAIHKAEGFRYFTDMSLWDTYRTVHPLFALIDKKDQHDMVVSLVKMCEQGGVLPRWPSGYGYTGSMLGSSADIMITDSYLKGILDFDVEKAYSAMRKAALCIDIPQNGFKPREGMKELLEYKYCPAEMMDEAVSKTLEYAYADHAISRLADALGKKEDAALFNEHSGYYKNVWNNKSHYFHPRNGSGEFVTSFKPLKLTYFDSDGEYTDDYTEGSALQWRWAVFFDPEGLISLFGDKEYFANELNTFFESSDRTRGNWNPGPYYWHGNEPDLHTAYLFNSAGRPDLTQKWVRWIIDNKYSAGYDGLDGDDDAGTLSAWYVFSALGFYPVAGSEYYQPGVPLFRKAEIETGGKILSIDAENYSDENRFVNKITLNGIPPESYILRHADLKNGGILQFEMFSGK